MKLNSQLTLNKQLNLYLQESIIHEILPKLGNIWDIYIISNNATQTVKLIHISEID